jgi:hypothetical protein
VVLECEALTPGGWKVVTVRATLSEVRRHAAWPRVDHGGLDKVEMIAIPQVRLDDPPAADEPAVHRGGHGGAPASSFGSRTRL